MTPSDLVARIDAGTAPLIVDVRSRREFSVGHVPGAVNLPLPTLLLSPSKLPGSREDEVVVYCGHGPRARMAVALMWYAGFRHLDLLQGHMAGWRRAGFREER